MFGRSAGVFISCALGASAFLLPPNVPSTNDDAALGTPALPGINTNSLSLQLPCSECAFSRTKELIEDAAEEEHFFIQGGANSVVVNFTLSEDKQRLSLNGETIYPLDLVDILQSPKIYVQQVPSSVSTQDIVAGIVQGIPLEVTGHGVSVTGEEIASPDGDVIVPVKVMIFELEKQPVSLDEMSLLLGRTASGELHIVHGNTVQHAHPNPRISFGHAPHLPGPAHEKECTMLPAPLCKLKNAIESRLRGMRKGGCHGRKGDVDAGRHRGHVKPHSLRPGTEGRPYRHHGRPHHMRPHGHHGHSAHGFIHKFARGLSAVLLPTMVGIAVGMTVSLIGLLVGRLIGFIWIKFYRGGRHHASVRLNDDCGTDELEGCTVVDAKGLEAPPVYCDVPAYDDAPVYDEVVKGQ